MAEAADLFAEIDSNGDGKLSLAELCSYYARTTPGGCSIEVAKGIILEIIDTVGGNRSEDCSVGRTEFYCYQKIAEAGHSDTIIDDVRRWRTIFYEYDLDGNGFVDEQELQKAFAKVGHNMSPDEVRGLISLVDDDENGRIDFLEFVALMKEKEGHSDA